MAGCSSLGMRLLTFSLVKPNFSLSSGKTTLCLLDGSCATSGEQGSSHSTGPRLGEGRVGRPCMKNPGKPLTRCAPRRPYSQHL